MRPPFRIRLVSLLFLFAFSFPINALAEDDSKAADQAAVAETERQIGELKESSHEAKARLRELEEAVLRGEITGSKALIEFHNEAEGVFTFSFAEFFLDDRLIQKVDGEGRKKPLDKIQVFDGAIPSGDHLLRAKITYRGKGLSYMKDHKFALALNEKFGTDYRKTTIVKLTAVDKGYFKTDIKERLALQIEVFRNWGAESPE
jgi:hypothetical protein